MMLFAPAMHIDAIDRADLNRLLTKWGHRMGAYTRPSYAIEAHHAMFERGEPVAVTAAGETVRHVIGQTGIRREQCVELGRLCAARPGLCRPMLRLWREMLFPAIAEAHGRALAVSYQDEALHTGDVYRFDGWMMIGNGGGTGQTGFRPKRRLKIWAWPPDAARSALSSAKEAA